MHSVDVKHVEAELTTGKKYQVPYWYVRTGKRGPHVLITAAQHANEIQGAEVLRRMLPAVRRHLVKGSCTFVPMANPRAIREHKPHMDYEMGTKMTPEQVKLHNLNCTWPGKKDGSNAQRLTYALCRKLVKRATHNLDLHCWNLFWASGALARKGHKLSMEFARAAALRFARHMEWEPQIRKRPVTPCTLTSLFNDTGRAALCIEFCGQYGFWEREVMRGERAVRNYLRVLKMFPGELEGQNEETIWLNDAKTVDVAVKQPGLFVASPDIAPSDWVEKDQPLGHVLRAKDLRTTELKAPCSGYLWQYGCVRKDASEHAGNWTHPCVHKGDVVAIVVPRGQKTA